MFLLCPGSLPDVQTVKSRCVLLQQPSQPGGFNVGWRAEDCPEVFQHEVEGDQRCSGYGVSAICSEVITSPINVQERTSAAEGLDRIDGLIAGGR